MSSLLDVRNLTAHYVTERSPVRAVDGVSFDVVRDEIFGIVGESGCGKSTLANAMLRLLSPPAEILGGKVLFNGVNLLDLDQESLRNIRWKHISFIPQGSMNSLNPLMKVEGQIKDAVRTHKGKGKLLKNEVKRMIEELLISVGLAAEVADMYPHELSGGMKQRVAIAMARALNPELIVADEPTTALDVVVQRGILQLLIDIKDKLHSSIIVITHDVAVHAEVCDRMAVMYAGKIVEIGGVRDLLKNPLHPYSQGLLSAVPSLAEKRILKGISGAPPDLRSPPPGCRFHPRCPNAMPKLCDKEEPPPLEVNGRLVACHLCR